MPAQSAKRLLRSALTARGLNTGSETDAGCELKTSAKAAPHLPVFVALNPPPHHCTCGCVVPGLARTSLLLNLTARARVICMLAVASGIIGCSGGAAMPIKIYDL